MPTMSVILASTLANMLAGAVALHGEAGAWDEVALIALGLLMLAVLAYVVWRSRGFEPELDQPAADQPVDPKAAADNGGQNG